MLFMCTKVAATKCRNKKKERTTRLVSESEILEMQNSSLKQVSFTVGCSDLWFFWSLRDRDTGDAELQPKAGQLHSRVQ